MIVTPPIHRKTESTATYCSNVEFLNENTELYFSIDEKFSDMLTYSSDPLLIALLIPCMQNNENLIIHGKISNHLFENIEKIQEMLCIIIPHLNKINVIVDEVVNQSVDNTTKNVFSGFSAGVDSFVTLEDYFLNPKYNLKITHFLFNNLTHKEDRLNIKLKNISRVVEKYNFPFLKTHTNLHYFYKKHRGIGFEQTHTMRNAAIAHFLSGQPNIFLYSSTFHKDLIQVTESNDLAIADDILLPLLSTPASECIAVGSEYTRLDKTLNVSKMEDAYSHLDTCIGKQSEDMLNCGICRKCMRALLTFELINVSDKFKNIFNLREWHKVKDLYLDELPDRTQLNDRELYNFIHQHKPEILIKN